ncbi:MAG: M23 family metallopeptidase [Bacteroidales bacterium]|nr:M23 family metallopeptidase [Bacteroidales bacterium]
MNRWLSKPVKSRLAVMLGVLCLSLPLPAQEKGYIPPFDFPIAFSGNFGELRSNHFHGGLDFKTQGVSGKEVRALADGYISRIRVTNGSGLVLDVHYQDGITTINRHLSRFLPEMMARVEDLQYLNRSYEVDIQPRPSEYPVRQGQVIAWSGNTGYSFGPHLHLDFVEEATDEFIDPMPYFAQEVRDNTPPRAVGFMLFPQVAQGVVNGAYTNKAVPLAPKERITAWGVIGIGIKAFDYMDGVGNRYGVHTVVLEVDGVEQFRSVVDRFSEDEHPYINSWVSQGYMKSFVEPGNKLRMLHPSNDNRGLLTIDEERPYQVEYTLKDYFGNTSKASFLIHGKRQEIPRPDSRQSRKLRWNTANIVQEPGLEVSIPRGCLYDDAYLCVRSSLRDSTALSYDYRLTDKPVAMHRYADVSIGLLQKPVADESKYYIKCNGGSIGGHYEKGYIKGRTRQLGTFSVGIDTILPTIFPVNEKSWGRQGRIVFKVQEKQTWVEGFGGEIDGEFALFGKPNAVDGQIVCRLNPRRMQKGKQHTLTFWATDACGNKSEQRFSFFW